MASLSEKISLLTNPAPTHLDPEDDVNIETSAKVKASGANDGVLFTSSELRSKAAVLLDDCDPTYLGKKVSRKSLGSDFHTDSRDDVYSGDENKEEDDDDDVDFESDEGEEQSEDDDLEGFKQSLHEKMQSDQDNSDEDSDHDDGDEDSDQDAESGESVISDDENTGNTQDMFNQFSRFDVTSDMEKGAAVKKQLETINRLCETRIRLQKILTLSHTFPQKACWTSIMKAQGEELQEPKNKASETIETILNNFLNIQPHYNDRITKQKEDTMSDEEIASDTDEEMQKKTDKKEKLHQKPIKLSKHKSKSQQYEKILSDQLKSLTPYRNSVLQTWDEKTKLSSGKITQKSFSAFETSVVKQIEQILQDRSRLIKRSQLKRSLYRIVGKPDYSETEKNQDDEINETKSKQDMLLKDYDPEIYDDDDFYRQFLRDVIESKSVGIDPVSLRKQLEIQSVRNKIKKKVDTKASKGRKIRYDVDPKLAGFAISEPTITDEARESILKSLCGGGCVGVS